MNRSIYNSTDEDNATMNNNYTDYNSMDDDTYFNGTDNNCGIEFFTSLQNVLGAGFLMIFVFSVLVNGLLIYIIVRFEDARKVSNLFFLCLASFNLLFTLTLPFWAVYFLHDWVFGEPACKIVNGAFFTGQSGSLLLLMAMTLDRFCTVVLKGRPLTQPGRRLQCARVVCVATWVISIAAGIRILVLAKIEFDDDMYYCSYEPSGELEEMLGYYMQFVFLFLIPLLVIVFCYGCILRTVLSVPHMRGRKRALVMLFCHIVTFVVCFVPFNIVQIYILHFVSEMDCETKAYILTAYLVTYLLAQSYCVVNPVFFLLRPSVRTAVYRHVCCLKPASDLRTSSSNSNDNTAHTVVHTSTWCNL